jgi:hypothetical protein
MCNLVLNIFMTEKQTFMDELAHMPTKKFFVIVLLSGISLWSIAIAILLLYLHFGFHH